MARSPTDGHRPRRRSALRRVLARLRRFVGEAPRRRCAKDVKGRGPLFRRRTWARGPVGPPVTSGRPPTAPQRAAAAAAVVAAAVAAVVAVAVVAPARPRWAGAGRSAVARSEEEEAAAVPAGPHSAVAATAAGSRSPAARPRSSPRRAVRPRVSPTRQPRQHGRPLLARARAQPATPPSTRRHPDAATRDDTWRASRSRETPPVGWPSTLLPHLRRHAFQARHECTPTTFPLRTLRLRARLSSALCHDPGHRRRTARESLGDLLDDDRGTGARLLDNRRTCPPLAEGPDRTPADRPQRQLPRRQGRVWPAIMRCSLLPTRRCARWRPTRPWPRILIRRSRSRPSRWSR